MGVAWQTALRRDERVLAAVLDAHQRRLAQLARLVAAGRDDDDRQTGVAQRVCALATACLVLGDLLADPAVGARLVFTFEGHGGIVGGRSLIVVRG